MLEHMKEAGSSNMASLNAPAPGGMGAGHAMNSQQTSHLLLCLLD